MKHYWTKEAQGAIMTVVLLLLSALLQQCNSQDFYCCDGAVRLSGDSLANNEGRVEVCRFGEWKTVCDNNWSENEARVVCRQLGYSDQGTVVPLLRAAYGQGTGTIVEHIRCSGTESQLTECNIRDVADGECTHSDDASVQCTCRTGDLRLQGSAIRGSGRVEICINNVWGTVCDDSWSSNDARVVCRQLGFSIISARTSSLQTFGEGIGPIHMNNVGCTGVELSLTDCPHSRHHSCSHSDDAAVQCQTRIVCHDGDVRLVNGSGPHEGRVEVCFNEMWGTICGDIDPWDWNITQANVVCQQLGYSGAERSTFGFGRGSLPVLVKYVYCGGYESNVGECIYSTSRSNCLGYGRDIIGVQCISSNMIQNGQVRLVNGIHKYAGRVEVYWNSEWRTVCYDGWDELDAQVVCRQLNYLSTSVQILATSYEEDYKRPMQLTNVGCNGSENNLTSCCTSEISSNVYCHSRAYAGVRCGQCVESDIKLVGELSQTEGYVLICFEGVWGKVGYGNPAAATVVCRQLGFSTENSAAYNNLILSGYGYGLQQGLRVLLNTVVCSSAELQLSQCNHTRSTGRSSGYRDEQFGVRCQTAREIVPGAPLGVQIFNITSSTITLIWSPPIISERRGLSILGYIINCLTDHSSLGNKNHYTDIQNSTLVDLHPFTAYNCCVAANSSNGVGRLACLRAVTLPSGVPTRLMTFSIDSTSVLVSWHAPDADEYSNGVLRQYYVETTDESSGEMNFHVADDAYLLLESLQPGHQYTFRVAAYTSEKGPFSEPISITLPSLQESLIAGLSSSLGLVSIALLIAVIVAIFLGYRSFKQPSKKTVKSDQSGSVPVQAMPYEVVEMSSVQSNPRNTTAATVTSENRPTSRVKQLKLKKKAGASREYSNSPVTDSSQKPTTRDHTAGKQAEKDNYQPLIPSKADEKTEYQSLAQKKGPIIPPAVPPKSKTKSTVL